MSVRQKNTNDDLRGLEVSRLQFGVQIFCNTSPNQLNQLEKLYYKGLRPILNASLGTTNDSLLAELGILPVTLRRIRAGEKCFAKCKQFLGDNPINNLTTTNTTIDLNIYP